MNLEAEIAEMEAETLKFVDVRNFLGNEFNNLQTEGDAALLAFELTYCLAMILESVDRADDLRRAITTSLEVSLNFPNESATAH